ncbi:putative tubulin--tyrosine ligase PBY1 [Ophiocordyceps camponoti-floridani]|uniref:Putative tubulin--tyrosine ligase PBY1 n=1 Tax=Ophiocordyceps camponoti-floridani TaxID=2030778 RepID=A0A8H4QE30_9HYPO|nr:putative tubulin--tyrosine ligase PBY1 [Ophiocordyceps camponoti-floridani]
MAEAVTTSPLRAIVTYGDDYVQPLIVSALQSLFPDDTLNLVTEPQASDQGLATIVETSSSPEPRILHISSYESIDFEYAASHPRSCLINSYMIRKALIRKHFLSTTVDHWAAKKPESALATHFKRCEAWELDYAEFLDDALVDAFDLRASFARNSSRLPTDEQQAEWWILKPGMSDGGQGIRLFSSMEELRAIFDEWEEGQPDSGDEDDGDDEGDGVMAVHLRHFIAQPYIHPPLLLPSDPRKFHIRTYVLCVGRLAIYVYKPMLALFAAKPYQPPRTHAPNDTASFLTNTCLQPSSPPDSVQPFWTLNLPHASLDAIFGQICAVTADVFRAAAGVMPVHFQPLGNAFEVFGLDFLVDHRGKPWLLEVNSFPDFARTGGSLDTLVWLVPVWSRSKRDDIKLGLTY